MGVRKSKSFATSGGQFECILDEKEATEKKKTMMAFFAADIAAQRATLRCHFHQVTEAGFYSTSLFLRVKLVTRNERGP
jgi:hypothetical protein